MPRSMVPVLVISVLLGGGAGYGMHERWPGSTATTSPSASGSTPAISRTPISPPPTTPRPSPSGSASPSLATPSSPSTTPTAGPTPADGPPFTERALLLPGEFQDRGWVSAQVVDHADDVPVPAITPCTTIDRGADGLVAAYASTYASARTRAAEVVVRFDSVGRAKDTFTTLREAVTHCADSPPASGRRVRVGEEHRAGPSGVSDLRWWTTRPLTGGATRGVIGLVRAQDRLLLISLDSEISDPAQTTQIESLLTQAGRRLV